MIFRGHVSFQGSIYIYHSLINYDDWMKQLSVYIWDIFSISGIIWPWLRLLQSSSEDDFRGWLTNHLNLFWFAWGKMLPHMFWLLLTTQWQRFPRIFVRSKKNLGNIWNGGSTEVWSLFMPFGTITLCFRKSFFVENPETSQAWVRSNEISNKF